MLYTDDLSMYKCRQTIIGAADNILPASWGYMSIYGGAQAGRPGSDPIVVKRNLEAFGERIVGEV